MSLTSRLVVAAVATHTSALDLATGTVPLDLTKQVVLGDGTGANAADRIWHDTRTLAASGTENLDLAGVLLDAFGATITLARIKALIVAAAAGNTNNVQVGGAAANGFANWVTSATAGIINVRPGGVFALVAPDATAYAVTAGTGDLLKMTNSAGTTSVTYDIVIIGSSV